LDAALASRSTFIPYIIVTFTNCNPLPDCYYVSMCCLGSTVICDVVLQVSLVHDWHSVVIYQACFSEIFSSSVVDWRWVCTPCCQCVMTGVA